MRSLNFKKRATQLACGGFSLLLGLVLFVYHGTRPRSSLQTADPERQRQILTHDILTATGLVLIFLGLFLLIITAAREWQQNSEP